MAKILIIDDEKIIRDKVGMILKEDGHEVFTAKDGIEGINIIKNDIIELVIMDVIMPKKGGIETLMELQNITKNMKIIIITGKVSQESDAFVNLVKNFGASVVINKPFKREILLDAIHKLLN